MVGFACHDYPTHSPHTPPRPRTRVTLSAPSFAPCQSFPALPLPHREAGQQVRQLVPAALDQDAGFLQRLQQRSQTVQVVRQRLADAWGGVG